MRDAGMLKPLFAVIAGSLLGLGVAGAAGNPPYAPPKPEAVKKWQDMRFGMFIHWGPVSLTAHEIGWSRGTQTPIEKYDNLYKDFNPTNFNADEWVKVAKDAGKESKKSFPAVTAQVVRLNILDATDGPTIEKFHLMK